MLINHRCVLCRRGRPISFLFIFLWFYSIIEVEGDGMESFFFFWCEKCFLSLKHMDQFVAIVVVVFVWILVNDDDIH